VFPLAQCGPVVSGPAPATLQARGLVVLAYDRRGSYLPRPGDLFFGPAVCADVRESCNGRARV
jgi:hypothetical protein